MTDLVWTSPIAVESQGRSHHDQVTSSSGSRGSRCPRSRWSPPAEAATSDHVRGAGQAETRQDPRQRQRYGGVLAALPVRLQRVRVQRRRPPGRHVRGTAGGPAANILPCDGTRHRVAVNVSRPSGSYQRGFADIDVNVADLRPRQTAPTSLPTDSARVWLKTADRGSSFQRGRDPSTVKAVDTATTAGPSLARSLARVVGRTDSPRPVRSRSGTAPVARLTRLDSAFTPYASSSRSTLSAVALRTVTTIVSAYVDTDVGLAGGRVALGLGWPRLGRRIRSVDGVPEHLLGAVGETAEVRLPGEGHHPAVAVALVDHDRGPGQLACAALVPGDEPGAGCSWSGRRPAPRPGRPPSSRSRRRRSSTPCRRHPCQRAGPTFARISEPGTSDVGSVRRRGGQPELRRELRAARHR